MSFFEPVAEMTRSQFVARTSLSALALQISGASYAASEPATSTVPSAVREAASVPANEPSEISVVLNVNGREHRLNLDSRVTLLDALRDHLRLTGTKKGCDQGTCGACTVLVNGRRIDSCLTLAAMHENDRITTVEGLADGERLHPLQSAFIEHDAFQCGYCTPGQIVSAVGMGNEGHPFDRETVRLQMSGNICRCGCYPHIVDAVLAWKGGS